MSVCGNVGCLIRVCFLWCLIVVRIRFMVLSVFEVMMILLVEVGVLCLVKCCVMVLCSLGSFCSE